MLTAFCLYFVEFSILSVFSRIFYFQFHSIFLTAWRMLL